MYKINPKRGCGTKKHDSFYAEADVGQGGHLASWCWLLGDGLVGGDILPMRIPPRGQVIINPAATLTLRDLFVADGPFQPLTSDQAEVYTHYKNRTKHIGVGDHVGSEHYSAFSFAKETAYYGPSRKMAPDMAKIMAHIIYQAGPVPILFSHARVPLFKADVNIEVMQQLIDEAEADYIKLPGTGIDWQSKNYEATWLHSDFGMSARLDHYLGKDHFMVAILQALDMVDRQWSEVSHLKSWQALKSKFNKMIFYEQAIGLSWLTRVSYTLPASDSRYKPEFLQSIKGLHIIDLDGQPEDEDDEQK